MLPEERQSFIMQQINKHNKVLTAELCSQLNVSLDTVRRDLAELEKSGKILKVHGGALAKTFHQPFQQAEVYAQEKKQEIAKKALRLIQDGMTFLAGGGTVMLEAARMIPENLKGTFFTVSPLVALEVAQRSSVEVILLAGKLSRNTYICTGASVVSQLAGIKVDLCLLGTNGISLKEGITDYDWEVVQVKKAMIKAARKTAVLCIAEKMNTVQDLQVCGLNDVDYLVTELSGDDPELSKFSRTLKII